jgi:azurin
MVTSHEDQQMTHHPTFKQYVLVAVILFAITIVEFVLIYDRVGIDDDLGASKIPLLIGMSAVKFGIVIMFYMHLKFESRLFTYIFLAGLGLAFAAGLAVLGIFSAINGEPRAFAKANAVPYIEKGHESEGEQFNEPTGPISLRIDVKGDTLAFDTSKFTATAGSEVVLTFSNGSAINQHNWVLVPPGTKDAVAAEGSLAGPANDWILPNDERVLANTNILDPGATQEIRFTLEPGTYQFVCTFPGHNFTMFGDFEATEAASPVIVETTETSANEPLGAPGLQISVQGDALEFDTSSLTATAGSEVVLTFNNVSSINQHNWVLVRPGAKDAVASDGTLAGPTNDWLPPDDERVIFHTKLLDPGESQEIRFTPEAGTYQFVCTFPGHNFTMFGDFEVPQASPGG